MIEITLDDSVRASIERADRMLAGIPGAIDKAMRSAISRTGQYTRTQISRRVRERYDISAGNLRTEENIKLINRSSKGSAEIIMRITGRRIPLYRFNGSYPKVPTNQPHRVPVLIGPQDDGKWRMVHPGVNAKGHTMKGHRSVALTDSFVATFRSGHTGIYERTGGQTGSERGGRDEIVEKMGLSIPQMAGNDEVLRNLGYDASEKFDERMDHEVEAILNGWR